MHLVLYSVISLHAFMDVLAIFKAPLHFQSTVSTGISADCGTVTKCKCCSAPHPCYSDTRFATCYVDWCMESIPPAPVARVAHERMGAGSYADRVLGIVFLLLLLKCFTALATISAGQGKISIGLTSLYSIKPMLRTSHH